jgi:Flp pilus assembly protein TadD
MKRGKVRLAAWLAVSVLPLAGCGRLFLSPRPIEASERTERLRARSEADAMDRAFGSDDDASPASFLREADRFARTGNLGRAVAGYVHAIQADPANPVPQARIANLQIARDPERAEGLFRRLVRREPGMAIAHSGLGLALLAMSRMGEAEQAMKRALELDPELANAHYGLSVIYDLEGNYDLAQHHARTARVLRPRDATVANNLGVSYLLSERFALAEATLRDAILLGPNDPAIRNNLGVALGRQGRFGEALEQFLRAGGEQAAYNNLGYLFILAGRNDDAIVQLERSLEAGGDDMLVVLRNLNAALDARDSVSPAAPAPDSQEP